jgi:predicted dehydrogenase
MVELARRKKLFSAEALWMFYLQKLDVLRQLLEAKAIGEIKSVYTDYGEYFAREHRIFDPKLAGGPLLDLGTYPVSLITKIFGVPEHVFGLGQSDPQGVTGQLSAILTDADGNQGTVSTTLYGFTPTNAVIVGSEGTIRFEGPFHLAGVFAADGSQTLRYEEPFGAPLRWLVLPSSHGRSPHQRGGSWKRPIALSMHRSKPWQLSNMIRRVVGIDFFSAELLK